jgi:hypothetical protein
MKMFYVRVVLIILLLSCSLQINPAGSANRLLVKPDAPALALDLAASPADDPDPRDETSIAVSPRNDQIIVGVSKDIAGGGDPQVRGITRVAYYFSSDGGHTWGNSLLGLETPEKTWGRASDPSVAADLDGNFYICALMLDNSNFDTSVYVFKSTDGGHTFGDPSPVTLDIANPNPRLIDKCYMTVDASPSSPFKNTVYAVWTVKAFQDSGQDLSVIRSAHRRPGDAGFSVEKTISHPGIMMGASLATGPDGEFYAAWIGLPAQIILFNASTDGGNTFLPADVTTSDVDIHNLVGSLEQPSPAIRIFGMERMHSYPVLDVDRSTGPNRGAIYVAWAETTNHRDADIFVEKLPPPNGGNPQPSSPVRVNTDGSGADQFFPWLSVDSTNGWVEVGFYDRRDDPNGLLNNMYLARSTDGGATFSENTRVSAVSSDPRIQSQVGGVFGGFIGLGDYLGMAAIRGKAHMFWTDTRRGKQDVFYGQIDFNVAGGGGGGSDLPGDSCQNARPVGSLPYQDTLDTTSATSSSDDPVSCTGSSDSNTVWYAITPGANTVYAVDTRSSNFNTVVNVLTGACGSLASIACNDDFSASLNETERSLLTFQATAGVTYLIEVSGKGSGGTSQIKLGFPTITEVQYVSDGVNADFLTVRGAGFASNGAVSVQPPGGDAEVLATTIGGSQGDGTATFLTANRKKMKKLIKPGKTVTIKVVPANGVGAESATFLFKR